MGHAPVIAPPRRLFSLGEDGAYHYGVSAGKWEQLDELLARADIIVAAAGADQYLYDKAAFKTVIHKRKGGSLLIVDIAVPRNFEPAVNELEGVYLYSIDDLAAGGGYIAAPSHSVPYEPALIQAMDDEIDTYGRQYYCSR